MPALVVRRSSVGDRHVWKGYVLTEPWYFALLIPPVALVLQPIWILLTAIVLRLLGVPMAEVRKLAVEQASHSKLVALITALRPGARPQDPPDEKPGADAVQK